MTFDELLINQKEVIRLFNNSYQKNKLSHAYLLEGDSGTGTYEAALYFAMMVLCKDDNKPCLKCNTCERVQYNSHPNVVIIDPILDVIRKEQIENLMLDFSMTALEKGPQVYIIKEADKLNVQASNALLKFLEEPNNEHYALLITNNHSKILDTIISRCQYIHFLPTPRSYIVNSLMSNGVEPDTSYIISHVTGDLQIARKYIEEGKLVLYTNLAKKIILAQFKRRNTFTEYYLNKNLLVNEKDKSWHFIFFDILILMYQELLKKIEGKDEYYFKSIFENVKNDQISAQNILKNLNTLNIYEERLNYNVSIDLLYSSLFVLI